MVDPNSWKVEPVSNNKKRYVHCRLVVKYFYILVYT